MFRTMAVVVALSVASASVALPAQAAQTTTSSFSSGLGSLISSLLRFKPIPLPPPPPPPPQAFIGVCNILKVQWLISACRSGFPGGGMSPG